MSNAAQETAPTLTDIWNGIKPESSGVPHIDLMFVSMFFQGASTAMFLMKQAMSIQDQETRVARLNEIVKEINETITGHDALFEAITAAVDLMPEAPKEPEQPRIILPFGR